jgi:hypothetical protein
LENLDTGAVTFNDVYVDLNCVPWAKLRNVGFEVLGID